MGTLNRHDEADRNDATDQQPQDNGIPGPSSNETGVISTSQAKTETQTPSEKTPAYNPLPGPNRPHVIEIDMAPDIPTQDFQRPPPYHEINNGLECDAVGRGRQT